jgi:hypothetical protein
MVAVQQGSIILFIIWELGIWNPQYNGAGGYSLDINIISMKECTAWIAGTYTSIFASTG